MLTLESARQGLQIDYPRLLENFDLHQGTFAVNEAAWDTLPALERTLFLQRCSKSRRDIVGSTSVTIRKEGGILATYDGITPVFYSSPYVALGSREGSGVSAGGPASGVASDTESGPDLIVMPTPVYPKEALRAGVEGTVWIKVLVGEDGEVHDIVVVGDGIAALNDAAVAAASAARFQPAISGGNPQAVWVQIPMRFSIMGKREAPLGRPEPGANGLASSVSAPSAVPARPEIKSGK
jgi:TonB family protein